LDFALVRYNPDGTPDATFGTAGDGKVTTDFGSPAEEAALGVALQADGKIVLAGDAGNNFALARYDGGGLVVGPGEHVTLDASRDLDAVYVQAGGRLTLAAGGDKVLRAGALGIQPGGVLDLSDNALVVDYPSGWPSPAADVRRWLAAGRGAGAWDGTWGIVGNAGPERALGYAEAGRYVALHGEAFAGQLVDDSAVLVRATLAGDKTLDRRVNFLDLLVLARNFNRSDKHWYDGDFDYDGRVYLKDLLALAGNYNASLGVVTGAMGSSRAEPPSAAARHRRTAESVFNATVRVAPPEPVRPAARRR
jgi:hypothetical protein